MPYEFKVTLRDDYVDGLEVIKSLLMTDPETGISQESPISEIYHACANVGLALLSSQMMEDGTYSKHREEVDLGNEVDEILRGKEQ